MKTLLARLMAGYHHLALKDYIWFPFIMLRPAPGQPISLVRLLVMTVAFGLYGGLLWPLKQYLVGDQLTAKAWLSFTLKSIAFFLVWFSCVTRPLWNQRARAINKGSLPSAYTE